MRSFTTKSRHAFAGIATLLSALLIPLSVFASNSGITYHGRVLKPDGTALESMNVQFRLQIRTPGAENCLMYEEIRTVNMRNTGGIFELNMNDGTGTRADGTGLAMDRLLGNRGSFTFVPSTCDNGSGVWAPNEADGRRIQVYFRDENMSMWEPLPSQALNFVPMAIEAKQIGGFAAKNLMRVEDGAGPVNIASLTPAQYAELSSLSLGASTQYLKSSSSGALAPTRATNPVTPVAGQFWFDTATSQLKFYDGATVQAVGASGGALPALSSGMIWIGNGSNVATASTVSGDATLASGGALSLKATGTAGTYVKVTTDAQGRVASGLTTLAETDLPTIVTPGKVSGAAITSGTIGGATVVNTTGAITTTGNVTAANVSANTATLQTVRIYNAGNTKFTALSVPAGLAFDFNFIFPMTAGNSGDVLTTNGAGVLSWTAASSGSVTSLSGALPITIGGTAAVPLVGVNAATTAAAGVVQLAASGGTTASTVVQATDPRLSDSRAPNGTASGDLSGTYPSPAVSKIRGVGVSATAPLMTQVLRYGGTTWDPAYANFSDLRSNLNVAQIPTTCTAAQIWSYSAVSDTFSCANISIPSTQVTGLGNASGLTAGVAANNLVQLDGSAKLPAVDGSALTNLNASAFTSGTLAVARGGTGTANGSITGPSALAFVAGGTNQNVSLTPSGTGFTLLSGKVGVGTTTPATALDVSGTLKLANGAELCSIAADGGMVRYSSNAIQFCNGTSWQTLGISGAGITTFNGSTQSAQTFGAVGVAGTGPAFSTNTGTGVHTLNIPMAATATVTAGLISKTDYDAFNTKQPAGNYLTALTGDVTAAGPGSVAATIAANAVITAKINDKAVTYAKIQDVANNRVLGRSTAGAGVVEELSLGGGLALAAGVLNTVNNGVVTSLSSTNAYLTVGGTAAVPTLTTNVGVVANTVAAGNDSRLVAAVQRTGDTMTGALGMGAFDITNAGNITLAASKNLQLGTYATDPSTAGWGTPEKGRTWFNTATNQIKFWDGAAIQVIGTGAGTVASVSGTSPIIITGTGTAPVVTIQAATSTQSGYVSTADWNTFNGKLGPALANGSIWVGASGVATAVAPSGDATVSTAGVFTVGKILGTTVSATPTTAGQVLRYSGSQYTPGFVAMTDLRSSVTGAAALATSCAASQTLVYNSVGDIMTCASIAIASTQVSGLGTAALLNVGVAANNVVQLATGGKLPAVDGSLLTSLSASSFSTGTLPVANGGTGTATGSITGTGTLAFAAGGTNQNVSLTPSGTGYTILNGLVGIGTATPQNALDVTGSINLRDATNGWSNTITPNQNVNGLARTLRFDNSSGAATEGFQFYNSNSSKSLVMIQQNGNVGIGTSTPSSKFSVAGIASDNANFFYDNANVGATTDGQSLYVYRKAAAGDSSIRLYNDQYRQAHIAASGNGNLYVEAQSIYMLSPSFGTYASTSSSQYLPDIAAPTVGNTTATDNFAGGLLFKSSNTAGNSQYAYLGAVSTTAGYTPSIVLGAQTAANGYAERLRIDPSGKVGIGTTSPAVSLDLGTKSDALLLPNGTTLQQPGTPSNGMIRYNTTSSKFEAYEAGAWTNMIGGAASFTGVTNIANSGGSINMTPSTGNSVIINQNTASTSSTTGALVVNGGAGIAGALNAGGSVTSSSSITTQSSVAATSGANQSSPSIYLSANYWNGATAVDKFSITNIMGTGTNPTATLTFDHPSGTTGTKQYSFMNGNVGIGNTVPRSTLALAKGASPTSITLPNEYLHIGGNYQSASGNHIIGFGYNSGSETYPNAYMGFQETSAAGSGKGDLIFGTRASTADLLPAEQMRITSAGYVGIGTNTPANPLQVAGSIASTSGNPGLLDAEYAIKPLAASSAIFTSFGTNAYIQSGSSNITGAVNAISGWAEHQATSTVTFAKANYGGVSNSSTGTITNAYGGDFETINSSTGTITNAFGARGSVTRSSGTITNAYGLWSGVVQGTNKWSVYASDATAPSYFAGKVGVGTSAPNVQLHVAGTAVDVDLTIERTAGAYDAAIQHVPGGASTTINPTWAAGLLSYGDTNGYQIATWDGSVETPRVTVKSNGNFGIGQTVPAARLDVAGTVKLGSAGTVVSSMGTCAIATQAYTANTPVNVTCSNIPAVNAIAVSCSPGAALSAAGTLMARATGTANQIAVTVSATVTTVPLTCMWMMP